MLRAQRPPADPPAPVHVPHRLSAVAGAGQLVPHGLGLPARHWPGGHHGHRPRAGDGQEVRRCWSPPPASPRRVPRSTSDCRRAQVAARAAQYCVFASCGCLLRWQVDAADCGVRGRDGGLPGGRGGQGARNTRRPEPRVPHPHLVQLRRLEGESWGGARAHAPCLSPLRAKGTRGSAAAPLHQSRRSRPSLPSSQRVGVPHAARACALPPRVHAVQVVAAAYVVPPLLSYATSRLVVQPLLRWSKAVAEKAKRAQV